MSIEIWLDLIRKQFSPAEGQILVCSLQQDPLVWQFIQDTEASLPYFEAAQNDFSAFAPGRMAAWLVEQSSGINLSDLNQYDTPLPSAIKTRAAQALETIFNTGLPPADLLTAGLLALIVRERRMNKNNWQGVTEEIFIHHNKHSLHKNARIWRTPFTCLFSFCSDFDDLTAELTQSPSETTTRIALPILIHTLLANPMGSDLLMEKLFSMTRNLSIDDQLESLKWLRESRREEFSTQLAKHLIQTKSNRDFIAQVFSDLEAYEAVIPEIDPLEKSVRYNLPEDVNRLAAFNFFSGNSQKAMESYQKASDLLEFFKAQTTFQTLVGDPNHISPTRWLELINAVPHSKQARHFYIRSLIEENKFDDALHHLAELPQSKETQLLQNQIQGMDQATLDTMIKTTLLSPRERLGDSSYFVHKAQLITPTDILNTIKHNVDQETNLAWLEKYLQTNGNDHEAVKMACDLYEKNNQIDKAVELTSYLERVEPTEISHKRTLARLYAQAKRWQDAFTFLQALIQSESTPVIVDLERFAEAAMRTDQVEMAISISQNIIKRDAHNTQALVLLGEGFMRNGDVIKAIQHMEGVVKTIPQEPDTWLALAWLWEENNQSDRAIETLKKGVETIPQQPKLLRALGSAHFEKQELPEALMAYKQAYDLDPKHIEGKLDLAQAYYQSGQHKEAFQLLESFIEKYEHNPVAARLLGHVLIALEHLEAAEPIILFAANHFPDDIETVISATSLVIDRVEASPDDEEHENLQKVETILNKAKETCPDHEQIMLHWADIDRIKGNYERAFEVYKQLTTSGNSSNVAINWRLNYGFGQAAMGLGKHEIGLAALQAALGNQPGNLTIRHALADALQKSDLPGKASAMANTALKLAPQDLTNILWYAQFKTAANEPEEAVQALKDALQITPQRNELKLWLAKSLISAGSLHEAHQTIENFISSAETNSALLKQAAYMCIHLNDLELAAAALEKALQFGTDTNAALLMDLATIYSLMNHHKKALDILDIEQDEMDQNPQIALIKADLLCTIGHYDQAYKTLKSIADVVEQSFGDDQEKSVQKSTSPLLYAHDLTLKGYYFRLGQLSRALGNFKEALQYIGYALDANPENVELKNAYLEAAMFGLDLEPALEIARETNSSTQHLNNVSQDLLDLICSQVEILLYQDDIDGATAQFSQLAQNSGDYPRVVAIQSRLAARSGKIDIAWEYLNEAIQSFKDNFSNLKSQSLPGVFRQMVNLHSIAEASLALGDHRQAIQAWENVYKQLESQSLHNWRYLYALVTAAEAQQIATTLAISSHCPGLECLSEDKFHIAEELLEKLNGILPQEQLVCLKARMISAFRGKWPLHLNVDACLQGAEEAAAVLIGSEDEKYVNDILESYPDDLLVLQAYGIYAIRNNKSGAIPYIENALTMDTSNPINHALLAHLKLDQPEQALRSLETALSFWPEESAWHALAADLYGRLGNATKANQHINIALEDQPENPGFWQTSAVLNINNNDLIQAKFDLEKSTAFLPDDPKTWTRMAEVNWRMGDASDAIKNIRKASLLDPENKTLVEVEMQFLYDQKNFTDLETRARETVSKDVSNETAQIFLAKALAKQGKFEQAVHTLDEAIRKDPNNPILALEKMKIKKDQVGVETVLPDLVTLARDNPDNPPILTTLTDWLIQSNRLEEAEQVAQTALRVIPEQAEVYVMLGRLQRARGKLDQAISHLSEAITLDPTLVDAYIEMGKTYQDRRDTERAIQMFEKGSQANPVDPRPYYHAGMALKDIKDYSSAEMMFKQAKRYSPDDANIIRQLGVVTALNLVNNLREVK